MIGLPSNRRAWFLGLLLGITTLWVYWPVRHYDFVGYDDDGYVFNNPVVRAGLSWQGLAWSFANQYECNWQPVTWLSHMLDCQLFGLHAGEQHLMNVLFHCANAMLLLLLLNSMTGKLWRSALVAALFALHPLRVESVAWISERKDVLSGFFFMLTLWMYVLHARIQSFSRSDHIPVKPWFYRWSWIFFILGLLAKSMLVTVPLVLLLLDFWPLKRVENFKLKIANPDSSAKNPSIFNPQLSRLLLEKLPFFLIALIVGIITLFAQRAGGGWVPENLPLISRIETVIIGYWGYVEKLLWPQNLSFLYLRSDHVSIGQFILAAVVLSGISVLVAVNLRRQPWLAVGWLWFVIMLLPVSGLLQLGRLAIADRYTYLPAIGFYLMAVWGIMDLLAKLFPQKICRWLAIAGAAAVLLACAILTRRQLACWQNTRTLMEHALKVDPNNYVAKTDLRIYLFEKEHPGVREHRADSNGLNSGK